jgi:hypothetical protein
MFSAILIVCIISGYKIRKVMGRKVHFFLFLILMMGALSLTVKMLSEKEDSVEMKGGHLNSMLELFQKNPSILLLGEGAGSLYYSKGVGENIAISELTYIELIRMYGIFGGGFILLLYFFPVLYLFQIKSEESHAIGWGYLAYLFIGGTNPLLVSSTGIILLAAVYSYIYIKRKIVL